MGVLDGQSVNAAITNPAFINKNQDDVMPNMLGFSRAGSGSTITDVQQDINFLFTATGVSESHDGTTYNAPASTIANGDTYETALTKLADKFDPSTGHTHSGIAGDGPQIPGSSIGPFTNSITIDGSTSGSLTIAVPATVTTYSITMPGSQGGVGSFLQNNGSGILSWASFSATLTAPDTQTLTGSGTYTTPVGALYLEGEIVGGGGGGAGSSFFANLDATSGAGASGDATFGSSLVSVPGGGGAPANTAGDSGMGGGAPTINSPAVKVIAALGSDGTESVETVSNTAEQGGIGGASFLSGPGVGGSGSPGTDAKITSGSGGGGGGAGGSANTVTGGGGGSGSYAKFRVYGPLSTSYPYANATGGAKGLAGTGGFDGGNAADSYMVITAYFQ